MKVYKIKNNKGLFSTGGMYPNFTKHGKAWSHLGHVKLHLNQVVRAGRYDDCVVVVYELIEEEKESFPIAEIMNK